LQGEEKEEYRTVYTKGERSVIDDKQDIGKACSNVMGRILSFKTGMPAQIEFADQLDLTHAGVLLSLPALLSNGLLRYEKDFYPDTGYYSIKEVFITLAFLVLLRVKTLAQSTKIPAGDLGKAIGLDRIPEVKTLRGRIAEFCQKCEMDILGSKLSSDWMKEYPELSGVLYVDGHTKIYYGHKTTMPKRYVSRLRLCMSGSTDYWVNDHLGQPFFVVNKAINSGMIKVLKEEIIPRLNQEIPNQPTEEELKENPLLHRYMLVADREVYSPDFFYDLWDENRIAICTYNKNVKDKWPEEEFVAHKEILPGGELQEMELAERGVLLQNKGSKKKIWAREIRKKSKSGHQTSIITTNYLLSTILIGFYMFARWSQENFFKYIMENFGIDTLVSYLKEKISDTSQLINPQYRNLESQLKSITSKLNRRKAKYATLELGEIPINNKKAEKYLKQKADVLTEIQEFEQQAEKIKQKKKEIPRKITFAQLPENEKFDNAFNQRKAFLDIIKMIAYRAETAMSNIIKPHMSHSDESRKLLQQVYKTDADIFVDHKEKILNVKLHRMTYWKDDKIIHKLCDELNETQTKFPGTDLTLQYNLVNLVSH